MGPAHADRALDDPNLALRIGHWSARLFNALQMVPSTDALNWSVRLPQRITRLAQLRHALKSAYAARRTSKSLGCQNLALDGDLMFDQSDVPPRMKETYGDHCHV